MVGLLFVTLKPHPETHDEKKTKKTQMFNMILNDIHGKGTDKTQNIVLSVFTYEKMKC